MNLDSQQKAAVETGSKKALVLAGAGSGKTRVLIERIAHLVENKKVSPYEILAFTFTRKAAGEVKSRSEERIGNQANRITMGTMHAIALKLIKRFGEIIGTKTKNVTVYSQWESDFLLKEVARDMGLFKKSWKIPKKDINKAFSDYYERGQEPQEHHPAYKLFKVFIQVCKENNALTYDSLLTGMKILLPHVAQYLHYQHILVDEIQDISPMQWSIINMLCDLTGASLFVVGDIDQSIYAFRGAVPGYLLAHEKEFDIYRLETNYRSCEEIVYTANKLINFNKDRFEKTMRAKHDNRGTGQIISIHKNKNSAAIADMLSQKNGKVAVLSRIHGLLQKVSRLLEEKGIDHAYIGGKAKLTNSEKFRRFHAFLKLIVNPYDNFAFLLIKDLIGLSPVEYQHIRSEAVTKGKSHFQEWLYNGNVHGSKWKQFFKGPLEDAPLDEIIIMDEICEMPEGFEEAISFADEWAEEHQQSKVTEYLDWLATYDIQDELTADQHDIKLMTVHAAKGLEFPTVIIAGCNEGLFPHSRSIGEVDEIEEERRLMYVAMTRAEDRLILTVRPERSEDFKGNIKYTPVSRFLAEARSLTKKQPDRLEMNL